MSIITFDANKITANVVVACNGIGITAQATSVAIKQGILKYIYCDAYAGSDAMALMPVLMLQYQCQ